jgi:enoyl-CoA hydratase/carnithine racemase
VPSGRPRVAELLTELVIDEMAQLVQEAERDPAVTP